MEQLMITYNSWWMHHTMQQAKLWHSPIFKFLFHQPQKVHSKKTPEHLQIRKKNMLKLQASFPSSLELQTIFSLGFQVQNSMVTTFVLLIQNKTYTFSAEITQVAEHVIAQRNVLWDLRWWTTVRPNVRGTEIDNPSVIFYLSQ